MERDCQRSVVLPGELCHLKSIFNLSDLPRNVIFPTAKLTQSLLLTFCDEIYITKKYFRERCSSLAATLAPPHSLRLWMLVNSTRVCAISLHLLSPWSSACFHLHPNPPLHLKVRMTALALVLSLCVCVRSFDFEQHPPVLRVGGAKGRQVELIVGIAWSFMLSYSNVLFS